jgi:hypothetical protein
MELKLLRQTPVFYTANLYVTGIIFIRNWDEINGDKFVFKFFPCCVLFKLK